MATVVSGWASFHSPLRSALTCTGHCCFLTCGTCSRHCSLVGNTSKKLGRQKILLKIIKTKNNDPVCLIRTLECFVPF